MRYTQQHAARVRFSGLPAKTEVVDGWERFAVDCVIPCREVVDQDAISFWFDQGEQSEAPFHFWIANAAVVQTPIPVEHSVDPVERMSFRGRPRKRTMTGEWAAAVLPLGTKLIESIRPTG